MMWLSGEAKSYRERHVTGPDGVGMFVRQWATQTPRAVLCYLHGQGDHSGPFVPMGDQFAQQGYAVYALDQRGFGQSPAPRGDVSSYDQFVADARHLLEVAREEHPDLPVYLLGLSMGGHIALRTVAGLGGGQVRGVIALSPGFGLLSTPWRILASTVWHYIMRPRQYLPTFIGDHVPTTRNLAHNERAGADPSWVQQYTARFYIATARSVRRARREMRDVRIPVLILQGGEEFLVDPQKSQRYFAEISSKDKEYRLLPGLYHNLVVEPEMPDVVEMIDRWMTKRLPK